MASAKDIQELFEAGKELRGFSSKREKAFAELDKARKLEAKATAALAELEGEFREAQERVQKLINAKFDGQDELGMLEWGGPPPGAAIMRARQVMGDTGENSGSRGRRSEIQPAIQEALEAAEQGMTNSDLQAAVSDRLGRPVNPGSLNQALSAMLKNKSIRRTGKRRSFLYWSPDSGEAVIRPGEELDKNAQAKLAELRDEDEDNDEEEDEEEDDEE